MSRAGQLNQPAAPALLREHEAEIFDLVHIATLIRTVTDEGGPIGSEVAGALSFLAYLASDRTNVLRKALSEAAS